MSKSSFPSGYDPQKDRIEIVPSDPQWPGLYALEKRVLTHALGYFPGLRIEHFGSTAVPGLAAKPILDIMVGVASRADWPRLVKPIESLSYVFYGDNTDKDEMFFVKGMPPYGERRTHHLHVYELEGERWKKELAFRDHLRANAVDAAKYGVLKHELAVKFSTDREAYTKAKTGFIRAVLEKIPKG